MVSDQNAFTGGISALVKRRVYLFAPFRTLPSPSLARERIYGVFCEVAAYTIEGPRRAIGVVVAIAAHVERDFPTVHLLAAFGFAHLLLPSGDTVLDRLAYLRANAAILNEAPGAMPSLRYVPLSLGLRVRAG